MRVRNLLRPAVAAALMEDQAAEEAVKKVLVSKRELEKTIADADYKLQVRVLDASGGVIAVLTHAIGLRGVRSMCCFGEC